MASFSNQVTRVVVEEGVLTSAYAGGLNYVIPTGKASHITLLITYAMGESETTNTLEMKIESATADSDTWHQFTRETVSSGAVTIDAEEYVFDPGSHRIRIPLNDDRIRLSFKETGVSSNAGALSISYVSGGK